MTFGQRLRAVAWAYGGTVAAARRVGVPRWTLYRWYRLPSAERLQVGTLRRIVAAFPELADVIDKENT